MKDASKARRSLGKLGILAAAVVILPLTATIVPAVRADENPDVNKVAKKPTKVVKFSIGTVVDGKPTGSVVKTISRDGKTYVFHSDKKLSDDEVEQWIDQAQTSREAADDALVRADEARGEAEAAWSEAEAARGEAEMVRGEADVARAEAAAMRGHAEAMRVHAIAMSANYVPEIDIREISKNCKEGQPVTTNVEGFDGTNKSRIRLVMCGKGQARIARVEAIKGLREARRDIASEHEMPKAVRKDVIEKLEKEIRKLEAQTDKSN